MEIPQLTFLRFIAATLVVIFHFGRHAPSLGFGLRLWDIGNTAVSFFFVFSGFILAHVYGRRKNTRPAAFYVARLGRVAPVYWLGLVVASGFALHRHEFRALDFALSALLLQSWVPGYSQVLNTPGWSLSVELFFYLCFPRLLTRLRRRSTRELTTIAGVSWAANLALHAGLLHASRGAAARALHEFTVYSPFTHVATFVGGVVGGILFARHRETFARWSSFLVVGSVVPLFAIILTRPPFLALHHNGLFTPLYLALLWGIGAMPRGVLRRVLARRSLVLLGEASYGIYILQGPVAEVLRFLLKPANPNGDAYFWTFYGVLVVTSIACFRLVETPLRVRIKRAFDRASVGEIRVQIAPPFPVGFADLASASRRSPGLLTTVLPPHDSIPPSSREAPMSH